MATYNNDEKAPVTGVLGTTFGGVALAAATGLLNGNGLGGLFGNNNPEATPVYQLSKRDAEIVQLKAEKHADERYMQLSERMSGVEARVATIEKTEPLRDQILGERIACLQNILNGIARPMVPNYVLAPGYGPAMVAPFPPPVPPTVQNGGTATTSTSSTANNG